MNTWHPDTTGVTLNPGNTLSDYQVTDEWTVRLIRDDAPRAYIDITFAVELNPDTERYSPEGVLYFVITDSSGDNDEYAEILYDNDHMYDYESPDRALSVCERNVHAYVANSDAYLFWDGVRHNVS